MVCILFGEITIFHSRVMGKKVYKYCMNVDDGLSCALGAAVYCTVVSNIKKSCMEFKLASLDECLL